MQVELLRSDTAQFRITTPDWSQDDIKREAVFGKLFAALWDMLHKHNKRTHYGDAHLATEAQSMISWATDHASATLTLDELVRSGEELQAA